MREYIVAAPHFSGFYEYELFQQYDELSGIEDDNPELYEELEKLDLVDAFFKEVDKQIDWNKTYNNISKHLVDNVYTDLIGEWVKNIEFDHLYSPRFYNYGSDEIYIKIKLTDEQLEKIEAYCFHENRKDFDKYLRDNFTDRDGFWSFIPNNIWDFEKEYYNYKQEESEQYETDLGILFDVLYFKNTEKHYVEPCDDDYWFESLEWLKTESDEEIARRLIAEHKEQNVTV
jgi:hypothetical protein